MSLQILHRASLADGGVVGSIQSCEKSKSAKQYVSRRQNYTIEGLERGIETDRSASEVTYDINLICRFFGCETEDDVRFRVIVGLVTRGIAIVRCHSDKRRQILEYAAIMNKESLSRGCLRGLEYRWVASEFFKRLQG